MCALALEREMGLVVLDLLQRARRRHNIFRRSRLRVAFQGLNIEVEFLVVGQVNVRWSPSSLLQLFVIFNAGSSTDSPIITTPQPHDCQSPF
eukprot:13684865-Heterocapsa_arctica.AAC.1